MTNKEAKNYKHQLPYTPEHSGNVSTTLEMPWVNVGYTVNIVGKRYYLAQNIPANEIDGYNVKWECPYIYLMGGEDAEGMLYNTIWKGVLNRLTFVPII